ncbi:MAG: ferritin family protein [bacterium]
MTLEEAIRTALEYEGRVQDVYTEAQRVATNQVGQRVFRFLAAEEKRHVEYLQYKLQQWRDTGQVTAEGLDTATPSPEAISAGVQKLENRLAAEDRGAEIEMLEKALKVEIETSNFYRRMVDEMDADARPLFARFVEIEEGHQAIVKAEIDSLNGAGFWFDMPEFHLEGE